MGTTYPSAADGMPASPGALPAGRPVNPGGDPWVRLHVIRVEDTVHTTPDAVWRVLADGWLYPLWVVGASRIRQVEDDWPAPGAKIHHSVGLWPAIINDDTEVLDCVPESLLELRARAWPSGEALVTVRLEAQGAGTRVQLEEDLASGPARMVPKPLRAPALAWRNRESLRRLAWLAERRAS
jgi:uncharacterized protein YndB with AHSA1/START domain